MRLPVPVSAGRRTAAPRPSHSRRSLSSGSRQRARRSCGAGSPRSRWSPTAPASRRGRLLAPVSRARKRHSAERRSCRLNRGNDRDRQARAGRCGGVGRRRRRSRARARVRGARHRQRGIHRADDGSVTAARPLLNAGAAAAREAIAATAHRHRCRLRRRWRYGRRWGVPFARSARMSTQVVPSRFRARLRADTGNRRARSRAAPDRHRRQHRRRRRRLAAADRESTC